MQLTKTFVEQVSPPPPAPNGKGTQAFYRDSAIIGFGLRVASGGAKSWILERRIRGKVKRITLGRCDALSLDKAKSRAIKLIKEIEQENAPRIINGKIVAEIIKLQEAFDEYIVAHPALGQLTIDDYQRSMRGPLSEWLTTPIRELSETNILAKHRAYAGISKARCNNAMRLLRAILNFAALHLLSEHHKPIITSNPVDILSRKQLWYPLHKTQVGNFIRPEQLTHWWQAAQQLRKKTTRDYLQFLLMSGLPRTMVSKLRFEDVDFDKKMIRLKSHRDDAAWLDFPVTDYLVKLLHASDRNDADVAYFLFPGLNKETAITDPRTAIKRVQTLSGVSFSLNDLYRTFIFFAKQTGAGQETLTLISNISKGKHIELTEKETRSIRNMQKNVFDKISDSVDL